MRVTETPQGIRLSRSSGSDLKITLNGEPLSQAYVQESGELRFLDYSIRLEFVSVECVIRGSSHIKTPNLQMQVFPPPPPDAPVAPEWGAGRGAEPPPFQPRIRRRRTKSLWVRIGEFGNWFVDHPIKTFLILLMIYTPAAFYINRHFLWKVLERMAAPAAEEFVAEPDDPLSRGLWWLFKRMTFLDFKVAPMVTPTPKAQATPAPTAAPLCTSFYGVFDDSAYQSDPTGKRLSKTEVERATKAWLDRTEKELHSRLGSYFMGAIAMADLQKVSSALDKTPETCSKSILDQSCRDSLAKQTVEKVMEFFKSDSDEPLARRKSIETEVLRVSGVRSVLVEMRKQALREIDFASASIQLKVQTFPEVIEALKEWIRQSPIPDRDKQTFFTRISGVRLDLSLCEASEGSLRHFIDGEIHFDRSSMALSVCPSNLQRNSTQFNMVHRLARTIANAIDECSPGEGGGGAFRSVTSCLVSQAGVSSGFSSGVAGCNAPLERLILFHDWVAAEILALYSAQHHAQWGPQEYQAAYVNALIDSETEGVASPSLRTRADSVLSMQPIIRRQLGCDSPLPSASAQYCSMTPAGPSGRSGANPPKKH